MSWAILCESSDLAAQCVAAAEAISLAVEVSVEASPCEAAVPGIVSGRSVALVYLGSPSLADLVELSHAARGREHGHNVGLAILAHGEEQRVLLEVAGELGLCATHELRPLCVALALLSTGADPLHAHLDALGPADRERLRASVSPDPANSARFVGLPRHTLGFAATPDAPPLLLGEAAIVRDALSALRRTASPQSEVVSTVEVDARAVLDVIFGPRRALSDPTSKSALAPYGIPLPVEELCSSASRAAAEASRIGYPVRISLASPDLRIWDHADLSIDLVDSAAGVRETFRQLIALAEARIAADPALAADAGRRVLGVLVTASNEPLALLRVRASALPRGRVALRIGFADPHGRASRDETVTILPAEQTVIERSLGRLAGADLLLATSDEQRRVRVDQVADVLQRVAAFVNDRRAEIESVELCPIAVLLDGSVEVREACVSVSDWFERNS